MENKKLISIFNEPGLRVVKSFIECEALQYRRNVDNEMPEQHGHKKLGLSLEGEKWVEGVTKKIVKGIQKIGKSNRVIFRSHGNTGVLVAELAMDADGKYWDWKKPDIIVDFCICGRLEHWGSVHTKEV